MSVNESHDSLIVLSTDFLNLMDIEPPIKPELDWLIWGEWAIWFILIVLVIGVFLKWGYRLYSPANFRWKLAKLMPNNAQNESVPIEKLWRLYGLCVQIKSLINPENTAELNEFSRLMERLNSHCFAKQTVSRETYLQLIKQTKTILEHSSSLRALKRRFILALRIRLKGNK